MLKKFRLNVIQVAIAALCFVSDTENQGGGGYAGSARARDEGAEGTTNQTAGAFDPFVHWINRHLKTAELFVSYEGARYKATELVGDGRLRLMRDGNVTTVPFDGPIIDELLPQIV